MQSLTIFEDLNCRGRRQGQGLVVRGQGQGQGLESQGRGQGQGLENWSSRTRTFLEDNNTALNYYCYCCVHHSYFHQYIEYFQISGADQFLFLVLRTSSSLIFYFTYTQQTKLAFQRFFVSIHYALSCCITKRDPKLLQVKLLIHKLMLMITTIDVVTAAVKPAGQ